jgi:hypothetical protein
MLFVTVFTPWTVDAFDAAIVRIMFSETEPQFSLWFHLASRAPVLHGMDIDESQMNSFIKSAESLSELV